MVRRRGQLAGDQVNASWVLPPLREGQTREDQAREARGRAMEFVRSLARRQARIDTEAAARIKRGERP